MPDEPAEPAIDSDSALVRHLERPAPPPPVERAYHDVQSGEPTDDHSTVELNRAAKDISEVRAAEALEVDKQRNADLNEALDFLAQEQSALAATAAPQPADEQVTGRIEAQPDYQPQPESVQQATDPQYDPELLRALQDPKVRGILERASQGIEATNAQFQQELANAALTATASFMSAFPELNGLSAEQLPGAVALIAKNDPVRAQAIAHHYRQVSHLVAQHQRVAVQQQEQQQNSRRRAVQSLRSCPRCCIASERDSGERQGNSIGNPGRREAGWHI